MGNEKCAICGKVIPEGAQICKECAGTMHKSQQETAEELRDIAEVLSITANTDGNIKKSMEALLRIAGRLEGKKK